MTRWTERRPCETLDTMTLDATVTDDDREAWAATVAYMADSMIHRESLEVLRDAMNRLEVERARLRDAQRRVVVEAYKAGEQPASIAKWAGVSRQTVYTWGEQG